MTTRTEAVISFLKKIYRSLRKTRLVFLKIVESPFRSTRPTSRKFGGDRGTPIVRYYIKKFLEENRLAITGSVLEMSEPVYTKKYGTHVTNSEAFHLTNDNPRATKVVDLTKSENLPENHFDCFICTQTLQFIYDFKTAIKNSHTMLKPGGVMLVTINGISQISRYDMDKWGEYWRFTTASAKISFEEVFGVGNVTVDFYGNCLSSCLALQGKSSEELTLAELNTKDQDYQLLITVVATKK